MDVFLVGDGEWYMEKGGRVTQVLGRRHYLCMYKWTTAVNKNMLWFLSMGNAGNLCRGSFFCRLYLLDFHTPPPPGPSPAAPTRHPPPTHNGQQEIGIQCFLDDFLKEMNPSQKMRTMNNGTPGGMCLTRVVRAKTRARSREACMK